MSLQKSPDGRRFIALLVSGDLAKNRNKLQILVGNTNSVKAACEAHIVAHLFTDSLSGVGPPFLTVGNRATWLDDDHIALLWTNRTGRQQVFEISLSDGRATALTNHPTNVLKFQSGRGGLLVYAAEARHSKITSSRLLRNGFSVSSPDVLSLVRGKVDGYGLIDEIWDRQIFLKRRRSDHPRQIKFNRLGRNLWTPSTMSFSPSGQYLLIDATPDRIPSRWEGYNSHNYISEGIAEALSVDRGAFLARQVSQLFLVDTRTKVARPLWDAPNSAPRLSAEWSPDSQEVLIGPTFLPLPSGKAGREGAAVAVVNVRSGVHALVPFESIDASLTLRWLDQNHIEIVAAGRTQRFDRLGNTWRPTAKAPSDPPPRAIEVEVSQDANRSPKLVVRDPLSGSTRELMDLNPGLSSRFRLGIVEAVSWQDASGRVWHGRLYHPAQERSGVRYPLVIQTHGFAPMTEFSLYGKGPGAPGLGPGWSIYAAQVLAGRGIAVLQTDNVVEPDVYNTPMEAKAASEAFESGVRYLASRGIVDQARVGLAGFSRTGWHVEYALAHSSFPYAAAIASDNFDGSYFQSLLVPGTSYDSVVGAAPFGDGLKSWLANSPAFNLEKVRAPLRLQLESGGVANVLSLWEIFSRLRLLRKPAELYVIPDIEHGSHGIQNPRQVFASQEGAVDWFDFWLNGHEDPNPTKRDQYARWEKLCVLQRSENPSLPTFCVPGHTH